MTDNIENKEKLNSHKKLKLRREITQKTSTEAETYNNLNSVSHKLDHEHDNQSTASKNENNLRHLPKKNYPAYRRVDSSGNPILKNGKHKISFIDKISQNSFADIIKVESFKEFNKMEEIHCGYNMQNNCCLIE